MRVHVDLENLDRGLAHPAIGTSPEAQCLASPVDHHQSLELHYLDLDRHVTSISHALRRLFSLTVGRRERQLDWSPVPEAGDDLAHSDFSSMPWRLKCSPISATSASSCLPRNSASSRSSVGTRSAYRSLPPAVPADLGRVLARLALVVHIAVRVVNCRTTVLQDVECPVHAAEALERSRRRS